MAAAKKSTRKSAAQSATATRRSGRPSNAERTQRIQSQQSNLIDITMAAASAAVKAAMGIGDGSGVTTIGAMQSSGTQTAGSGTKGGRTRQAPGRKVNPESKMSLTRDFYAANLKSANPLSRAELVRAAAKKFGYTPQTGNTYISKIDSENGNKLSRRRSSNGRSRGAGNQSQSAAAAG